MQRIWHKAGLKPHRLERYMASDDPEFERKAADIIGLYLHPDFAMTSGRSQPLDRNISQQIGDSEVELSCEHGASVITAHPRRVLEKVETLMDAWEVRLTCGRISRAQAIWCVV